MVKVHDKIIKSTFYLIRVIFSGLFAFAFGILIKKNWALSFTMNGDLTKIKRSKPT